MTLTRWAAALAGNRYRRRRLLALILVLGYTTALSYVSLYPVKDLVGPHSRQVEWISNLLHVPAYAVLAVLWVAVLRLWWRRAPRWKAHVAGFIIAFGVGALLELAQLLVPGRFFSATDLYLNFAGCIMPAVAALIFPTGPGDRQKGTARRPPEARIPPPEGSSVETHKQR